MDQQIYYHPRLRTGHGQPVANIAQLGPNPPLLDVLDADMAHEPFVAAARGQITVAGAAHAAAYAELLLNCLSVRAH